MHCSSELLPYTADGRGINTVRQNTILLCIFAIVACSCKNSNIAYTGFLKNYTVNCTTLFYLEQHFYHAK